ncbi:hypothetical protein LguiB_034032 [Lonicera macranthoides]
MGVVGPGGDKCSAGGKGLCSSDGVNGYGKNWEYSELGEETEECVTMEFYGVTDVGERRCRRRWCYISTGSDLFFKLTGPGIFGASLFNLLPTIIPQMTLLLVQAIKQILLLTVSGLWSSTKDEQAQAALGMGLIAGTSVMLLTLVWGSCVLFGSFDLSNSSPSTDIQHNTLKTLTGFGVRTDDQTSDTARIMILSMVPFVILQLAKIINSSAGIRVIILIALIVTILFLAAYSSYQGFRPWIQNRRFEYTTLRFVKDKLLTLLSHNGRPNVTLMKEIFNEIDKNKAGSIWTIELRVFVIGIQLQEDGAIKEDYIKRVIEQMDISVVDRINEDEFVALLSKWLKVARKNVTKGDTKPRSFLSRLKDVEEEGQSLIAEMKKSVNANSSWWDYLNAAFHLVVGTALLVFMRNITSLVVFLSLVYIRDLSWDYSAEVLVVLIICTTMGLFTSFCTEFPHGTGYLAYFLYPFSLVFLYVLTTVLGWS